MADIHSEKCIDFCYGEYKNGIFGKKSSVRLGIYPSNIEGIGFIVYEGELNNDTTSFKISYDRIREVYIGKIGKGQMLLIEYIPDSVVSNGKSLLALPGIKDMDRWVTMIIDTKQVYDNEMERKKQIQRDREVEQNKIALENEQKALKFYQDCYSFHIKESTPIYQLFSDKNKVALIYISDDKFLNFLKIDGYAQEESNGVISYNNIHYYEKAGNISYVTDIHGKYASYGGSMTGGKYSKLATVGGGLLFGIMGMAMGAALTYKPAKQEEINTTFTIDSDIKKIDDRSVILNFYSDMKRQYIDIELPHDIYNFLQTYFPEKKYSIVDELEKKTAVHQSTNAIENGSLLKSALIEENVSIGKSLSTDEFKAKVEKLKIMKDAGLLSDEKFNEEQEKLLQLL